MAIGVRIRISSFVSLTIGPGSRDDDVIDRLNNYVMYLTLIFMAAVTGSQQLVGTPIKCWLPAQYFRKFQEKYANTHCWVNSLYNIPFDEAIPGVDENRYSSNVNYYRWVSVIFIVLAVLFRVPQLLWRELKHASGANVEKLIRMTIETALVDQETREKQLSHVAEFFHRWVTSRVRARRYGLQGFLQQVADYTVFCYGKRSGHHLVLTYIFIKLLYLLNSLGQFFLISSFLNTNYWSFGLHVWNTYYQHGEWENDDIFPRVALCDMKIRQMQNIHTYTFQCVLTVNLFLEKIFLLVWFLLIFVLIANTISFLKWTYQLLCCPRTGQYVKSFSRHLLPDVDPAEENGRILEIFESYLRPDGVFVLRMIQGNTTDLLTTDLMQQIFLKFKKTLGQRARINATFKD